MKIDMKNKKVRTSIIGAVVVVLGSVMIHGQINKTQNNFVSAGSAIMNLKANVQRHKMVLLEANDSINRISLDKSSSVKIEEILKEVENMNDMDSTKINENVEILDKFNEELDAMINIYENDADMKKDILMVDKMGEIDSLNNLIDEIMIQFNESDSTSFNKNIKKFPTSIVAKLKGWYNIESFKSI